MGLVSSNDVGPVANVKEGAPADTQRYNERYHHHTDGPGWINDSHQIARIALSLSKLHLVHTLTGIPMHVRATLVHDRELQAAWVIVRKPGTRLQATKLT